MSRIEVVLLAFPIVVPLLLLLKIATRARARRRRRIPTFFEVIGK
jgi:hypothetical protein